MNNRNYINVWLNLVFPIQVFLGSSGNAIIVKQGRKLSRPAHSCRSNLVKLY